jgi:outer membrane protein assembly factor BamB
MTAHDALNRTLRLAGLLFVTLFLSACSRPLRIAETDRFAGIPDWPRFGGDLQNRHVSSKLLRPPLQLVWTKKASAAIGQSLVVVDGIVYFATMDGRIYAVDALSGRQLWRKKTKRRIETTCVYAQGSLVLALRYGRDTLRRYDLTRRKFLWKVRAGSIETEPLVAEDEVYVASVYGGLRSYDFATGSQRWVFKADGQLHSSPALADSLVVFGSDRGDVYAVRRFDGGQEWRFRAGSPVLAAPAVAKGRVYIGDYAGSLYALDAATGSVVWKVDAGGKIVQAAASDGTRVIVGTARHKVLALAADSGEPLWEFSAESVISTSPLITPNLVYIGSLDHYYYALDLESGNLVWRFKTKGRVRTDPVVWDGRLFGASEDNWVYSFTPGEPGTATAKGDGIWGWKP